MTNPVHEQLLGHLLGALDEPEQEVVEARLKSDPKLRRQLTQVRRQLEPLSAYPTDFVPPPGLARRTCRLVASHANAPPMSRLPPSMSGLLCQPMTPEAAPPSWIGSIRWLDVAMAAGVFVAAALLTIPAIQSSRFNARVTTCQNNLREIGQAMTQYSENHYGFFPPMPPDGELAAADSYAQFLLNDALVSDPARFVCPGSALNEEEGFHIPSADEIRTVSREKLVRQQPWMGGSYGYCLGHLSDGAYRGTKNLRRPTFAVLSDVPGNLPGYQSDSHGGRGQNVWFEDGHVRFLTSPQVVDSGGSIFANDAGYVAPGVHRDDSVIVPSSTPIIWTSN